MATCQVLITLADLYTLHWTTRDALTQLYASVKLVDPFLSFHHHNPPQPSTTLHNHQPHRQVKTGVTTQRKQRNQDALACFSAALFFVAHLQDHWTRNQ